MKSFLIYFRIHTHPFKDVLLSAIYYLRIKISIVNARPLLSAPQSPSCRHQFANFR